jgi:hypothetical protein
MAASFVPLPFPGRRPGTMPAASPPASFVSAVQPDNVLPGTRQGPSLRWEGWKEGLSPFARREACSRRITSLAGKGKLTRKGISPSREREAYERRLRTCPKGQGRQAHGRWIPRGDLLSSPGNTHEGRAVKVHCGRLVEGIITIASTVMMDKTGWSSPIGAARQAE